MAVVLLVVALLAYAWYLRGGPFGRAFLVERRFARLAVRSATMFGGVSVLLLAAMGRLADIVDLPREFAIPAVTALDWLPGLTEPVGIGLILLGLVIGGGIGTLVSRWRGRIFAFGDVTAVLPRARGELGWAALLAVDAGVSEELFFRLLLPLLIAQATGSAWIGFAGATALFGFAHRYQGLAGVLATTFVGVLLTGVYLASGNLWMAMLLHMAINLNGLVLRPLAMGVGKSPTRTS